MADLLTHVALAHCIKRLSWSPQHALLFALGTALPDLVGRAPGLGIALLEHALGQDMPYVITLGFDAVHMPFPFTVFCLFVAWCLPERGRRVIFYNLLLGGYLHFGVDVFQKHLEGGYHLLFPFTWWDWELGLIGSEESLYVAGPLALLALGVELLYRRRRRPPHPVEGQAEGAPEPLE